VIEANSLSFKMKQKIQVWGLDISQEFGVLYENTEAKSKTGSLYLSRFDFTLKHVPDTKIEKADRLSRRLDWKEEIENDNDNQILIKN